MSSTHSADSEAFNTSVHNSRIRECLLDPNEIHGTCEVGGENFPSSGE